MSGKLVVEITPAQFSRLSWLAGFFDGYTKGTGEAKELVELVETIATQINANVGGCL